MIPETEPVNTALVPEEDDRRVMSAIKICGTLNTCATPRL